MKELQCKCLRCNHKWQKRQDDDPVQCPACKSPLWNKKRKNKRPAKAE
jgi:DNA-directed RNA polymerase subunit RPC12/RpoP